ncbi:agmatinase [candidate division KSB1 bacterium]|nr:agmatinase [candidate division KSB1 bacterium]
MTENSCRFLGNDLPAVSYKDSRLVIVPAPLEKTVSYGAGTADAAEAILKASGYVELYDEEFDKETCDIGIFTHAGLSNHLVQQEFFTELEKLTHRILQDNKFPVIIGGEHSLSIAPVRAAKKLFGTKLSVLQLDAHTDLRDSYEGSPHSHASVMRRVHNEGTPAVAVGIRSLCKEEAVFMAENKYPVFFAKDIYSSNAWISEVINKLPDNIYITFDIDALDPTIISQTGTPEPGGMTWYQTLELFQAIRAAGKHVVGFDLVEFAPGNDSSAEAFTCAKMIYKMIGYFCR